MTLTVTAIFTFLDKKKHITFKTILVRLPAILHVNVY